MAGDDRVYRLTWIFEGQKFTAEINATTANARSQIGSLESADVKLTNVTSANARKRVDANKAVANATIDASRTQITAANNATQVVGPATERVSTSLSRYQQIIDRLRRAYDPLGARIAAATRDIASSSAIIDRYGEASKEGAEAVGLLAAAQERLRAAQNAKSIDTYDALVDATNRYKTATLTTATSTTRNKNVTTGETLQSQIDVANPAANDPRTLEMSREWTAELNKMSAAAESASIEVRNLIDSIDPVAAIEREAAETTARYTAILNDSNSTLEQRNALVEKLNRTKLQKIDEATGASAGRRDDSQASQRAFDDYNRLATAANRYKDQLNPLIDVQRKYRERISEIRELTSVGLLTNQQATAALGNFVEREELATKALKRSEDQQYTTQQITRNFAPILRQAAKDHVDYASTSNKAFGLNRIGMLELQAAGINTFQALAAGMDPLHVATMEGSQAIGAFVQGGLRIRTLVSVIAPLVAITAVIAGMITRFVSVEKNAKDFTNAINLLGQGSNQTPEKLQKIIDSLREVGVSGSDARKGIDEIFKAVPQGLNVNFAEDIAKTALDISASPLSKGDFPANVKALTDALTGGVTGFKEFGIGLKALDEPTLREMDRLNGLGRTSDAVAVGLRKITNVFSGEHERSLSKSDRLIISLTNSWNRLTDTLVKSEAFTTIISKLTEFTETITKLIDNTEKLKNIADTVGGAVGGAVIGGRVAGLPGAVVGSVIGGNVGVSGTVDAANKVTSAWDRASTAWDDLQEALGHGRPGGTAGELDKTTDATKSLTTTLDQNKAALDKYSSSIKSSAETARDDLRKALSEREGYTQKEIDRVAPKVSSQTTSATVVETPIVKGAQSVTDRLSISSNANLGSSDEIKKLIDILGKAVDKLPQGYSATVSSAYRPMSTVAGTNQPSLHGVTGGRAVDVKIVGPEGLVKGYMGADVTGTYRKLEQAVETVQKEKYPELTGKMAFGTGFRKPDAGHIGIEGGRGIDTTTTSTAVANNNNLINTTLHLTDAQKKQKDELDRSNEAFKKYGVEAVKAEAFLQAYNTELGAGRSDADAVTAGNIAAAAAVERLSIEWGKSANVAKTLADNTVLTTTEYKKNEVAGIQQAAMTEAINEGLTLTVDVRQRYNQILTKNATEAILNSQKEATAFGLTLTANENLATATANGTAAAHEADLQNQAVLKTHNALALAEATHDANLIKIAKDQQASTLEQIKANDALTQTVTLQQNINTLKNELQSTQLQATLTAGGATSEQITAQLDKLKAIQYVQQQMAGVDPKIQQNYLNIVDSTSKWKIKLSEIEEQQRRINDVIKDIADTIVTELGGAIDDAFDQKKAKDWGERLKDILKDVIKSASESLFLKPLLGSLADTLGFSSAGKSLGTISGTSGTDTGTVTSLTGDTSTGALATTAAAGIGGVSATGLLGLGGSTSSTGSVANWINTEIGPTLGFKKPAVSELTDLGEEGSSFSGGASESGSLFGGTTLTGALGGAATGLGAGGLVSSLLGGNTTTGAIGGTVGGLVGSALLPGFGGFIGGALGGLTGLFGNNTKSNDAAGSSLDLTTGKISGTVTSKDSASNQDVEDIGKELKDFTKQLKKDTGGTVTDIVSIQSGLRDGIKVGYGGIEKTFTDSQEAIDQLELDIAKNVTGVTDTYHKVIDALTDPADIADALTFIDAYDSLKDAADSAFTSIDADTEALGPYALAMDDLNKTFDDLTVSAKEFGLSLDPINDGLDEATKRLQDDFGKSLDAAFDTAVAKDYINTLQDVSDAFISNRKEASAIGLTDTTTTDKISKLEVAKAKETLDTLTNDELKNVVDDLADTAPEISILAQSIIDAGTAADDTTTALTTLADGLKSIQDLSKSLRTGELSGLTDVGSAKAAITTYERDLSVAQKAGDKVTGTQLDDLAVSGEAAINASLKAYGNAPKTADLRRQVVKDLAAVESVANSVKEVDKSDVTVSEAVKTSQDAAVAGIDAKATLETLTPATIVDADILDKYIDTVKATDTPKKIADGLRALVPTDEKDIKLFDETADYIAAAAGGASGTPPGRILVGEVGPEWMGIPSSLGAKDWNWSLVGKHGPEIIDQKGGATILPFPIQPKDVVGQYDRGTGDIREKVKSFSLGTVSNDNTFMAMYSGGTGSNMSSFAEGTKSITSVVSNNDVSVPSFAIGTKFDMVSALPKNIPSFESGTDDVVSIMSMPSFARGTSNVNVIPNAMRSREEISLPKFAMGMMNVYNAGGASTIQSFAEGTSFDTTTLPTISDRSFPTITDPGTDADNGSFEAVVNELRSLRKENGYLHDDLIAIKKQVQGGQNQAMTDAKTGNSKLSSIDNKLGSGLVTPARRVVG